MSLVTLVTGGGANIVSNAKELVMRKTIMIFACVMLLINTSTGMSLVTFYSLAPFFSFILRVAFTFFTGNTFVFAL